MLQLSPLPSGNTARAHFLAIQQVAGSLQIFGELEVEVVADLEVIVEPEMEIALEADNVVIVAPDIEVEVCT